MQRYLTGKRSGAIAVHDTLKHDGKHYAIKYVRMLPVVGIRNSERALC